MLSNIGRLKRTLKEKCECGGNLQLRVKVENGVQIEYKFCHRCEYESKPVHTTHLKNMFRAGDFVE
jgi:hypothetical protein